MPTAAQANEGTLITRGERKQRTRSTLIDAALKLMSEGRSFTSLGLREVTREAGLVPTAFYRHFRDMDELGLALVEEGGLTLRRLLREARKAGVPAQDIVRSSVRIYLAYVREHHLHFGFIVGERMGGSPTIRRAIRTEVNHFANEMAQDIQQLGLLNRELSTATLQMICGLVVSTMLNAASDILDLPPKQTKLEEELLESYVRQLLLIFLGAMQWREKT
jgi:AcrR family transcriptional regulator